MLRCGKIDYALLLFAAATGLAIVGCGSEAGPERAAISGSVFFDGKPVEEGTILFVPDEGTHGPASGGKIQAGRYEIPAGKGPVLGNHKVQILANRDTGKTMEAVPPASGTIAVKEQYIPKQFNEQTTLTLEIRTGDNTQNFDLKL